jgi:hypothetical protein
MHVLETSLPESSSLSKVFVIIALVYGNLLVQIVWLNFRSIRFCTGHATRFLQTRPHRVLHLHNNPKAQTKLVRCTRDHIH